MPVLTSIKRAVRTRLIARSGGIDLTQLDRVPSRLSWPLSRDGLVPVPRVAAMRTKDPVAKLVTFMGMDVWVVTGAAEARQVLADTTSYSTDIRPYMGASGSADGDIGGLGFTDPPEHTRLRRLLTPEFTMRRLARLKPAIDAIIDRQLAETEQAAAVDGTVDLMAAFCFPVPFLVICELLGLPDDRRETFRALGSARFDVTAGGAAVVGAISGSREFLFQEATRQRRTPGPGLIGQIIREHGDEINDFDLGGLADGAFTGGLETSASMLGLGTVALLQRPELWERLQAEPGSGPERGSEGGTATVETEAIVDELLRYLSVVQVAFPRFVKHPVTVGGHDLREGSVVLAHLPAANRDERTFSSGESFDAAQATGSHVAFGHGFHRCVGAELAKMELRAAYPALVRRFPDLQLAVPDDALEFHQKSIVYGLKALPVRLS